MNERDVARFLENIQRHDLADETVWIRLQCNRRKDQANGTFCPENFRELKRAVKAFLEDRARKRKAIGTAGFSEGRDSVKRPAVAWKSSDKQSLFFARIASKYGLSKTEYLRMLVDQGAKCLCCCKDMTLFARDKSVHPVVDHCHETGAVRGLLCTRCNVLVGRVERAESDILAPAKSFLAKTKRIDSASHEGKD